MLSALSLGATLYMPATRPDLWQVVNGEKYPELRSLVICLEDAVSEHEVEAAKVNLRQLLRQVQDQPRQTQHPKIFIRPRHIAMAEELAQWQELIAVDGMVLPKFCLNQLRSAKIQFLNLGNLVICPKKNCLIIFKYKMLIRIDTLTNKQHTAQNLKIRCADGS